MDSYLKPYDKEIEQLIKDGHSIRTIVRILNTNHQGLNASRSQVHYWIKKKKEPNIFQKKLSENFFDMPFVIKHGWLKTKEASIFIKNNAEVVSFDEMREDLMTELKAYSPKLKKIKRNPSPDPHLLVIDIADLHMGKLGDPQEVNDEYNNDIAIERALKGVEGILQKSSGFNIDQILFIAGNDVLHTDNSSKSTTSLTPQDMSSKWYRNFKDARKLYVKIIERLLTVADIHLVHCPSNHDYVSGFMLADSIYAWFRNSKNITFDIGIKHRKYYKYGESLIGAEHGDGAKPDALPLIMANEAKQDWATTEWHYIYLHHIHHKQSFKFKSGADYHGCTVEHLRSPSGDDSWHMKKGYTLSPKAIEGFIHSKEFGQVARLTHLFK